MNSKLTLRQEQEQQNIEITGLGNLFKSNHLNEDILFDLKQNPRYMYLFSAVFTLTLTSVKFHKNNNKITEEIIKLISFFLQCTLEQMHIKWSDQKYLDFVKNTFFGPFDKNMSLFDRMRNILQKFHTIKIIESQPHIYNLDKIQLYWQGVPSALMWIWVHLTFANNDNVKQVETFINTMDIHISCPICFDHFQEHKKTITKLREMNFSYEQIIILLHFNITRNSHVEKIVNNNKNDKLWLQENVDIMTLCKLIQWEYRVILKKINNLIIYNQPTANLWDSVINYSSTSTKYKNNTNDNNMNEIDTIKLQFDEAFLEN